MTASADTLLLITTSFPRAGDGSEAAGAFVSDLALEVARHAPVRVVAPGGARETIETWGAVPVYRYASPDRPLSLLSPKRPSDWPGIFSTLTSLRRQTLHAGSDGRVAHAIALWALPSGWAAASLKSRVGVPYSIWALGSDIWSLGRIPGVRGVLRSVAQGATRRFADGLKLAEDAEHLCGRSFEFLPSTRAIDVPQKPIAANAPPYRFLFLGRWHANKGIDLLLDSLEMLDDQDWDGIAEVHIAGGGPLNDLVLSRVAQLGEAGRPIRLSGYLGNAEASAALARADMLLLPSRIESIPVVFSDAMKAGLPVVSSPVGDLPALIDRFQCGYLAKDVSPQSFAQSIRDAVRGGVVPCLAGTARAASEFDLESISTELAGLVAGSRR